MLTRPLSLLRAYLLRKVWVVRVLLVPQLLCKSAGESAISASANHCYITLGTLTHALLDFVIDLTSNMNIICKTKQTSTNNEELHSLSYYM